MKLYEITKNISELDEMLDKEIITEQDAKDTKELLQLELQTKSSNIIGYINNITYTIESIDKEIERLKGLKKARENKIESIKKYITSSMELIGQKKIETDIGTFSLRPSETLEIIDESLIDKKYKTSEIEIINKVDKALIKADIKKGVVVSGVNLQKHNNLQIK